MVDWKNGKGIQEMWCLPSSFNNRAVEKTQRNKHRRRKTMSNEIKGNIHRKTPDPGDQRMQICKAAGYCYYKESMKNNRKETWFMGKNYDTPEKYKMPFLNYGARDKPLPIHSHPIHFLTFGIRKFYQRLRKEYVSLYCCESLFRS